MNSHRLAKFGCQPRARAASTHRPFLGRSSRLGLLPPRRLGFGIFTRTNSKESRCGNVDGTNVLQVDCNIREMRREE